MLDELQRQKAVRSQASEEAERQAKHIVKRTGDLKSLLKEANHKKDVQKELDILQA